MTHEMRDYVSLGLAWGGALASAVTNHINLIFSAAAALAALIASLYSIRINMAKWRKIRAHEEALCRACGENPGSVECPFPEYDRPENCRMKVLKKLKEVK